MVIKEKGTVLIIEDDQFYRKFLSAKLRQKGYKVITAGDGKTGLEKLYQIRPALVLLDLVMPQIDGFEVLARIREDQKVKAIPVIIVSVLNQGGDIKRVFNLGANEYICKDDLPPMDSLFKKIKKHFNGQESV